MPKQKTVKAFHEWTQDAAGVQAFLDRVAEVGRLQKVCMELKKPYTLMHPFLHSTPELKARYDAARAAWADKLHDEKLEIADKKPKDMVDVANRKLRIEVRDQAAKAYNRDRFGETLKVEKTVNVGVSLGLKGRASELLSKISGRTIEHDATVGMTAAIPLRESCETTQTD